MSKKGNTTNTIWGIILIVMGLAFLADQFTVFNFGRVIGFAWPLLLAGLGIYLIVKNPSRPVDGVVLLVLGGIFLLGEVKGQAIFGGVEIK